MIRIPTYTRCPRNKLVIESATYIKSLIKNFVLLPFSQIFNLKILLINYVDNTPDQLC